MEKIKVISINPVDGKKFWSAQLEDGRKVTVWPSNDGTKKLIESIQGNLNVECGAVLKPFGDNGFNLRAFEPGIASVPSEPEGRKSVKGSAYEKDPVGLAVEVFCALMTAKVDNPEVVMTAAIKLVKQAQEAFN